MAFGAWAEYALLEEKQTVLKPSYLSYEEAAVLASASKTAIGALCTGQLQSGQSVNLWCFGRCRAPFSVLRQSFRSIYNRCMRPAQFEDGN